MKISTSQAPLKVTGAYKKQSAYRSASGGSPDQTTSARNPPARNEADNFDFLSGYLWYTLNLIMCDFAIFTLFRFLAGFWANFSNFLDFEPKDRLKIGKK